jgi:hypothetical protein
MSDPDSATDLPEADIAVDVAWIADWAAIGLAALERYLAVQAAFSAYLETRNRSLNCDHGDRCQDV